MSKELEDYFYVELYGRDGIIYTAFGTKEDHVFKYDTSHYAKYGIDHGIESIIEKVEKEGSAEVKIKDDGGNIYKKYIFYMGNNMEKIVNEKEKIIRHLKREANKYGIELKYNSLYSLINDYIKAKTAPTGI